MLAPDVLDEVVYTLSRVRDALETLMVRGVRAASAQVLDPLRAAADEFTQIGAGHVASWLRRVVRDVEARASEAPLTLLSAQACVRTFERVLTVETARSALGPIEGGEGAEPKDQRIAATMSLGAKDRRQLLDTLADVTRSVCALLSAGLTVASEATLAQLDVAFRESSRFKLLRLSSTLRLVSTEIRRYVADDPNFSAKRLAFFIGRVWLLAAGLTRAVEERNEVLFGQLNLSRPPMPVKRLTCRTVGVVKKVVPGVFCSFEFRLRALGPAEPAEVGIAAGDSIIWSFVFPLKGKEIPAEGFLHLAQPQKFKPVLLVDGPVQIENAAVSREPAAFRLQVGPPSKVAAIKDNTPWTDLVTWNVDASRRRLQAYEPSPVDLEIELQDEVLLTDWEMGEPNDAAFDDRLVYPIVSKGRTYSAIASKAKDGEALRERLAQLAERKRDKPALFGLMHYEAARLVFQPLSALSVKKDDVELVALSNDKIDPKTLLGALNF